MSSDVESRPAIWRRSSCFTSRSRRAALCRRVRSPMRSRSAFNPRSSEKSRQIQPWMALSSCSVLLCCFWFRLAKLLQTSVGCSAVSLSLGVALDVLAVEKNEPETLCSDWVSSQMQLASRLLPQTLHLVLPHQTIGRSASYGCERRGPLRLRAV